MQYRALICFLTGGLIYLCLVSSAVATHCQIHGRVLRGAEGGKPIGAMQVLKIPAERLGMDTVYTDSSGAFAFTDLPGGLMYHIRVNPSLAFLPVNSIPGGNTVLGDSGEESIETRLDNSTLGVWVKNGCISSDNTFLIAAPADTIQYRTFNSHDLIPMSNGQLLKPVRRGKGVPNASNLLWEIVTFGGFAPGASQSDAAGGMRVGISYMSETGPGKWKPDPSLSKQYCWVRLTKWNFMNGLGKNFKDLQTTLEDKSGEHTQPARGLDSLFKNGIPAKPMWGEKMKLPPKFQNNRLFADIVALKINIASSELGQTPLGFGDLVYQEDNELGGLSISQIALKADSALSFCRGRDWDYHLIDSVIRKINEAFRGTINASDTISFVSADKLILTGVAPVYQYPYLSSPKKPPKPLDQKARDRAAFQAEPDEFVLDQNYPNPFNPTTTIRFELSQPGLVTLKVFNTLGQEVSTVLNREQMEDGTQEVDVNGNRLASGAYFYRVTVEDPVTGAQMHQELKKMVLLK
ncbi:MAG: T9SS type A sorting domain-containing protein [Ignavibacteria bacterium]|nr:MAG: T9SS type A sorting domain-containing protein [Ignavibacteria bacterium]